MSCMRTIPSRAGFLAARSEGEKALSRGLVIQAIENEASQWRSASQLLKK